MGLKEAILERVDAADAWESLYPGWKPGKNVQCANSAAHAHGDRDPSMSLSKEGKAYCHSCGFKSTSPIGVLEALEELDYPSALREAWSRWVEPLVPESELKAMVEALASNRLALIRLEERRGLSSETIKKYELGWDARTHRLAIPVRNEFGLLVNIRLYDLMRRWDSAKTISYSVKGDETSYGKSRLWPLDQAKGRRIFIFEGEMDTLLALSMGLPAMTVTIGAATWKEEWSEALKGKDVVLVPDVDPAGLKGLEKKLSGLKRSTVSVIKLPLKGTKEDKDFTDWVVNHGGTADKLRAFVKPAALEEIDESGDGKPKKGKKGFMAPSGMAGLEPFGELSPQEKINIARGTSAFSWMTANGAFFKNQNQEIYYAQEGGRAFKVGDKAESFLAFLSSRISYAINSASSSGKFVIRHIMGQAGHECKKSMTGSWGLYHEGSIFLYAAHDKILWARDGTIKVMKNAINEKSVLLECPPENKEFVPELDVTEKEAVDLFWECLIKHLPVSHSDKYLIASWLLGVFTKEYVKPKPLVRLMARTAYGKSTASKMLAILLYGDEVIQNSATTVAAIYALAQQYPLMVFDNIETHNMTSAFQDFLLTAATGGTKTKRAMSTDSGVVPERTNCLTLTNGIEPINRRELVSRTAEISLDTVKYGSKGFYETQVFSALRQNRGKILCGLLKLITRASVPRIRAGEVQRIAREFGGHSKNRFDEYLGHMAISLDSLWLYKPSDRFETPNKMVAEWLKTQTLSTEEQDEGTNDVLYFLSEFADRHASLLDARSRPEKQKDGSVALRVSTRELFTDFRILARSLGVKCPWQNERHLGTRIVDASGILEKAGWTHKKVTVNGRNINVFTRKGEAADVREVVEGPLPGQGVRRVDVPAGKGATRVHSVRRLQGTTKIFRRAKGN